jgi:hypothetical protein
VCFSLCLSFFLRDLACVNGCAFYSSHVRETLGFYAPSDLSLFFSVPCARARRLISGHESAVARALRARTIREC